MDIRSPNTCVVAGNVLNVELRRPAKTEGQPDRVQDRRYLILRTAPCEGGDCTAKYLAVKLELENGFYRLSDNNNEGRPIAVVLDHISESIEGKPCLFVTGKDISARIALEVRKAIDNLLTNDKTAIEFRERYASDKGPVIKGRDYGRLQISAGDDRRQREFFEEMRANGTCSKAFPNSSVTLGDVCLTQFQVVTSQEPERERYPLNHEA